MNLDSEAQRMLTALVWAAPTAYQRIQSANGVSNAAANELRAWIDAHPCTTTPFALAARTLPLNGSGAGMAGEEPSRSTFTSGNAQQPEEGSQDPQQQSNPGWFEGLWRGLAE